MSIDRRLCLATLAVATATFCFPASAAEHGTREEAKALSDAVTAHIRKVGVEQAAKDLATDRARWTNKDLFAFVQEFSGVMRYHLNEKMIGKNFLEVKDASGKEFAKDMVAVAKGGKPGWVDYEWAHPVTKKVEDKSAYIQRVPGTELLVGVGFYR
jgi:cytochrome c